MLLLVRLYVSLPPASFWGFPSTRSSAWGVSLPVSSLVFLFVSALLILFQSPPRPPRPRLSSNANHPRHPIVSSFSPSVTTHPLPYSLSILRGPSCSATRTCATHSDTQHAEGGPRDPFGRRGRSDTGDGGGDNRQQQLLSSLFVGGEEQEEEACRARSALRTCCPSAGGEAGGEQES